MDSYPFFVNRAQNLSSEFVIIIYCRLNIKQLGIKQLQTLSFIKITKPVEKIHHLKHQVRQL